MTKHDEAIEALAREVYADLPFDDSTDTKPEWVQRGNSHKQDTARDTARRYAKAFLSTYGNGDRQIKELLALSESARQPHCESPEVARIADEAAQTITTLKEQVSDYEDVLKSKREKEGGG